MFVMSQPASTGTEKKFIDNFIYDIETKSRSKVICRAADYHMDDLTPSFTLTVNDVYQITFTRNGDKDTACNDYFVTSNILSSVPRLVFGGTQYYATETLRYWQYNIIGSNNALLLEFTSYATPIETPDISFVSVYGGGTRAVMSSLGSFSTNPYIYVMSNNYDILETNYLSARTSMEYDSTKPREIRIADNKHMHNLSDDHFVGDIAALKDCMYVPARKNFVTVDGREYFCVCEGNPERDPPLASTVLEVT